MKVEEKEVVRSSSEEKVSHSRILNSHDEVSECFKF